MEIGDGRGREPLEMARLWRKRGPPLHKTCTPHALAMYKPCTRLALDLALIFRNAYGGGANVDREQ